MLLCWEGAAASLSGLWGWAAGRGGSAGPGPGCRWGWSSLASQCCRQLSSQLQAKARSEPVVLPANRCCVSNVPSLQKHSRMQQRGPCGVWAASPPKPWLLCPGPQHVGAGWELGEGSANSPQHKEDALH